MNNYISITLYKKANDGELNRLWVLDVSYFAIFGEIRSIIIPKLIIRGLISINQVIESRYSSSCILYLNRKIAHNNEHITKVLDDICKEFEYKDIVVVCMYNKQDKKWLRSFQ